MPRPKVTPDARQRVVQACAQCKSSKRKCSGSLPCDHCIKRGFGDTCHFLDSDTPHALRFSVDEQRRAGYARQPPNHQRTQNGTSAISLRPARRQTQRSPNSKSTASDGEALNTTKIRMLSNRQGEKLFIGESASLSFLEIVRETVSHSIGASDFSDEPTRDRMLEADLQDVPYQIELWFDVQRQQHYLENYILATSGVVDVVTKPEAMRGLQSCGQSNPYDVGITLLVMAIGAQTLPANENDFIIEKASMRQAQAITFASQLEDPSLDMVRLFILLAFYMFGACRRNAGFMYLGVAARAAHALGLHHAESYKSLSQDARCMRLRCWKSLVSIDLIVSSLLGRASATYPTRMNDSNVGQLLLEGEGICAEVEAGFRLAILVDTIMNDCYESKVMTVGSTEAHLRKLRQWSESLPPQLRLSSVPETNDGHAQKSFLGSLQVSCFYYFTIMLVTRPFLIEHLTGDSAATTKSAASTSETQNTQETSDMATACLNAAMYMAQACSDFLKLDLLLENMCLIKAWVFAAGLVLGFHLFVAKEDDQEAYQAFMFTCNVLIRFSTRSAQATHYLDILNKLHGAILKHRQIKKTETRKRATPLVDRLFDLHPDVVLRVQDAPQSGNNQKATLDNGFFKTGLQPDTGIPAVTFENGLYYGWDGTSFDHQYFPENQNLDGMDWSFPWQQVFEDAG